MAAGAKMLSSETASTNVTRVQRQGIRQERMDPRIDSAMPKVPMIT